MDLHVPHPDPPSHLPLHLLPLGLPSAPGPMRYHYTPVRMAAIQKNWEFYGKSETTQGEEVEVL